MSVRSYIKRIYMSAKYNKNDVYFSKGVQLTLDCKFSSHNRIGRNSFFCGELGYGSYIGGYCSINAVIGKFCCIAPRVVTTRGNHPSKKWVSIHPAFFSTEKQCGISFTDKNLFQEKDIECVRIGNDVWIGDSVILVGSVKINDGAIVASGSVVTNDVPPYAIVAGVPAKIIKYRFEESDIKYLLNLEWWNKSEKWIVEHADYFEDIKLLINKLREEKI